MDFIKSFWENQGRTHQAAHTASWGDILAIELEIEAIGKHIEAGNRVLDIGCANGFSLFRQLEKQPAAFYVGVDYADSMISHAKEALAKTPAASGKAEFKVASILELPFENDVFDVAYTTRVLINLPTWDQQQKAILESLRVVKPGGRLVISEAFWEPLCAVNSVRQLTGLEPLTEHDFNRYLKKSTLEAWLKQQRIAFSTDEFSSVYYLGSRVMREFLQKEPLPHGDYSSPVNSAFFNIERQFSGGPFSVQQAYIIKK